MEVYIGRFLWFYRLIQTHFEGVVAHGKFNIANGRMEGLNQKIKTMLATCPVEQQENVATWGALSLYLDFINLFIYLLRFFGNRD